MKRSIALILLLGLATWLPAQDMGRSLSLFTDTRSDRVGKGITVLIMEFSEARNEARTESKKQNKNSVTGAKGTGAFSFFPELGLESSSQNDFKGDARTSKRGTLKAKVAARIVGKNEAGDFLIEGKRVLEINNEKEILIVSGAVRPEDINPDNTVYSYNIYDAHIVYKGKGEVSRAQKGGMLTRVLQWLF
ncbi:MAG: flagellar basal body L-ring protein FlgH [Calditrichaeota bacterium]|nr:MAG: flagellar basal body L-ring protein FlgH [Calditrichota bacterium]